MQIALGFGVAFSLLVSQPASAQCSQWRDGFGATGLGDDPLQASTVDAQYAFDDGAGMALYVGGVFATAGGVVTQSVARWKTGAWEAIGNLEPHSPTTSPARVRALHAHDAGAGPELYAGGIFSSIDGVSAINVAKWNGSSWTPLAQGLRFVPTAMVSHDDGSGVKLYVASTQTGGAPTGFVSNLAAWDGVSWSDASVSSLHSLHALAVFDDGSGPALYAVGPTVSGGGFVTPLLRRAGSTWSATGLSTFTALSTPGFIRALEVFDDGSGPALYVGGVFASANGVPVNNVVRWDGANASPLGSGVSGVVDDLHAFNDGSGAALFASGGIATASGVVVNGVARWQGGAWSALGSPAGVDSSITDCLEDFDDGSGPALYVGGPFDTAGGVRADQIARWSGGAWSSVGLEQGFDGRVNAVGAFDSGAGVELYAAGWFEWAGTTQADAFAKWNGASWSAIAISGFVNKLLTFDDGSGEALFAAGNFSAIGGVPASQIARWDGTQWTEVGGGVDVGQVAVEMATYDDGSGEKLWIAGDFTSIGGIPAKRLARWDGATWWSPPTGPGSMVYALAAHDDGQGGGRQLYVGGGFVKVGGVNHFGIARWNGTSWSQVGGGFDSNVVELAVFDDGSGPQLYAAGNFNNAPPQSAGGIARWDGVSWHALSGGTVSGVVYALEPFDDGSGPALFAGGAFSNIGGAGARNLAVWKNSSWQTYGQPNASVFSLAPVSTSPGAPPALLVGGAFTTIDGGAHSRLAVLERACPCPPSSYCTAGVSTNGCAATLNFSGAPSASLATPFVVTASGVEGQKLGLLFYGVNGRAALPWGASSSLVCVKAPTQRTSTLNSGGTANSCDGVLALDWNAYQAANPGALGQPFQAGDYVHIQGWYRDPPSAKTTALTNALEARVCP